MLPVSFVAVPQDATAETRQRWTGSSPAGDPRRAGEEDPMLSPVAKALDRLRGNSRMLDLSPLPCPACGLRIGADHRAGTWGCSGGHRYPTTRTLIAALIASGWCPSLEFQIGPSTYSAYQSSTPSS
jgi:hypothetical protein